MSKKKQLRPRVVNFTYKKPLVEKYYKRWNFEIILQDLSLDAFYAFAFLAKMQFAYSAAAFQIPVKVRMPAVTIIALMI